MWWNELQHTLLEVLLGTVLFGLASCASDDAIPVVPTQVFDLGQDFDYVLFTRSGSSANGFVTGFDSLPAGQLDVPNSPSTVAYPAISGGVSFQNYVVNQQKLFGGPGYQRVTVGDSQLPVDGTIIETFGGGSSVVFESSNRGYYVDFNTTNIQIFDPSTFERIGEIDMSESFQIPENSANYYNDLFVRDDKLYACLYTGLVFPPFVYQSNVGAIVAVVDLTTERYERSITFPGTKYPGQPFLRFKSNAIDESGDLYLVTQGGLGLEQPGVAPTPAKILRIPAGSDEFDPDYEFIPQLQIAGAPTDVVINAGFLYAADGIAYTNVLVEQPSTSTDLVNLPLMRWARIDLVQQTAELIVGMPRNAGLTAGMAYLYQGKVLLTVYNAEEQINAIYETSPDRADADLRLQVTAGGIIYGLYEVLETQTR
ncbi:MAG: hypothetical protein AAGA85_08480 [Bacteroidota bacterium]